MNRRTVALLALTAVVALGGCAGLLGSESTTTPTNTTNGTAADAVHKLPLNSTAVLNTHERAVADAGSFQYQANATKRIGGLTTGPIYTNKTFQHDSRSGESWELVLSRLSPSRETYLDGQGNAYQARQTNGSEVGYGTVGTDAVNHSQYQRPPIGPYLAGLEFTAAGTSTVDGTTVDTYTVSNMSQVNRTAHGLEEISTDNLDTIDVTIQIDRDGVVRSFDYAATGSTTRGDEIEFQISLAYTDIGSTDVREPAWLPEVRNGTE